MMSLVQNEWMKIFRRRGTLVMLILTVVAAIGVAIISQQTTNFLAGDDWKQTVQDEIKDDQKTLNDSKASDAEKQMAQENIATNQLALDKNINPYGYTLPQFLNESTFLISFVALFMVVIAATTVSSEFSFGSIKLLMIRPFKRYKILTSKLIAIFLTSLVFLAVLLASCFLIGIILFGFETSATIFDMSSANGIKEVAIDGELFLSYLYGIMNIMLVAILAFALANIFKENAIAVGISIFLMLSSNAINFFLQSKFDWAKYLFFANTSLVGAEDVSFTFVVQIVHIAVFLFAAYFVFSKRDITNG